MALEMENSTKSKNKIEEGKQQRTAKTDWQAPEKKTTEENAFRHFKDTHAHTDTDTHTLR